MRQDNMIESDFAAGNIKRLFNMPHRFFYFPLSSHIHIYMYINNNIYTAIRLFQNETKQKGKSPWAAYWQFSTNSINIYINNKMNTMDYGHKKCSPSMQLDRLTNLNLTLANVAFTSCSCVHFVPRLQAQRSSLAFGNFQHSKT